MSALAVLATIAWPLALGVALLHCARVPRKLDPLAWWGWAWFAGALTTGLVVWIVATFGLPLTALPWIVPALTVVAWGCALRCPPPDVVLPPAKLEPALETALFRAVLIGAILLVIQRILIGSTQGIVGDDELFLWARKAQLIYQAGGLNERFAELAQNPADPLLHADYPLLNPLLQVWVYAHAGEITHFVSRLPIQGFAIALVVVLAAALRRTTRPGLAALLLVVVVSLPTMTDSMRRAQADLMVGAGLVVAADALLRWSRASSDAARRSTWRIACLGLAAMVWSKNEGMLYLVGIAVGSAAVIGRASRVRTVVAGIGRDALWLVLPALTFAVHRVTNARFEFRNDLLVGDEYGQPFWVLAFERARESLPVVADYFWNTVLLDPASNQWLLLAFGLTTLIAPRAAFAGQQRAATVATLVVVAGIFLVYTGTPKGGGEALRAILPAGEGARWHLSNSAPRIFAQITPALALVLALRLRSWPRQESPHAAGQPIER